MVMTTHSDIVKSVGRPEEVALAIGVSRHTVRSWIQRDSIPADQWHAFANKGWATLDALASAAARKDRAA